MAQEYYCAKGCCKIKIQNYVKIPHFTHKNNRYKAGVFLYDPKEDRILLVQSRGQFWGLPKGSLLEDSETTADCALRELKEETGISLDSSHFIKAVKIRNRALYYYVEYKMCDVDVQQHENLEKQDANGITWIKIDCLKQCIQDGSIDLNLQTRIAFKKFLFLELPISNFIKIVY